MSPHFGVPYIGHLRQAAVSVVVEFKDIKGGYRLNSQIDSGSRFAKLSNKLKTSLWIKFEALEGDEEEEEVEVKICFKFRGGSFSLPGICFYI